MIAKELRETTPSRVWWLCSASRESALALCSDASVGDPAEVHCARFALHFAMNVPLPDGYAWEVVQASQYRTEADEFVAPVENHVRVMAIYASDLNAAGADLVEFCRAYPLRTVSREPLLNNREFDQAAIFRFAHSPKALDDERLLELSYSEDPAVRHGVASIFDWRKSPYRNQILTRLLDDPYQRVGHLASHVAGRTGDPELLDLVAAKGHWVSLSMGGDPRCRPFVEEMANSAEALARIDAVGSAVRLEDRGILSELWHDQDWEVRKCAILGSAQAGLIEAPELDQLLAQQSADHIVELLIHWPNNDAEWLHMLGRRLVTSEDAFPSNEALAAGHPEALDRVRTWIRSAPKLCGAAMRLLPEGTAARLVRELASSPEVAARAVAAETVGIRGLADCFPLVAELCLDADDDVAKAADDAICYCLMRCGLYGLDTAILGAGKRYRASPRSCLNRLIKAIIAGVA